MGAFVVVVVDRPRRRNNGVAWLARCQMGLEIYKGGVRARVSKSRCRCYLVHAVKG